MRKYRVRLSRVITAVIAIIFVYAASYFVINRQPRDLRYRSVCIANLRQVGSAIDQYKRVHHEYPENIEALSPYVDEVFTHCRKNKSISYEYIRPTSQDPTIAVCRQHKRTVLRLGIDGKVEVEELSK